MLCNGQENISSAALSSEIKINGSKNPNWKWEWKKKTQKKMSMADLVHAQIAYHAASKWTGRYKILAVIMRNIWC